MNKTTIGRIVHFWEPESRAYCPALVTRVHTEAVVDVTVFPNGRLPYTRSPVSLFAKLEDCQVAEGFVAFWPPREGPALEGSPYRAQSNPPLRETDPLGDPLPDEDAEPPAGEPDPLEARDDDGASAVPT